MVANSPDIKAKKSFRWRVLVILIVIISSAFIAIFANSWKGNLFVSEIKVKGNVIVPTAEVLALAGIKKGEALFDVDLFEAQKRVSKNGFVRAASVHRNVPDEITIVIEERVPVAVLAANRTLYVDAEGYVLPPARSESIFDLPIISGVNAGNDIVIGKRTANVGIYEGLKIISLAQEIDHDLYRQISEIRIDGGREVTIFTSEGGVPVLFGLGRSATKLVKLDAFWKEVITRRGVDDLISIDVRFEDQVVVRWQNEKADLQKTNSELKSKDKTS